MLSGKSAAIFFGDHNHQDIIKRTEKLFKAGEAQSLKELLHEDINIIDVRWINEESMSTIHEMLHDTNKSMKLSAAIEESNNLQLKQHSSQLATIKVGKSKLEWRERVKEEAPGSTKNRE